MSARTKEAASLRPAAEMIDQPQDYLNSDSLSRPNLLEQAAEVLCLLALFPLSATEQVGFVALLGRRVQRAYLGGRP
jgi:hypothetical protein